MSQKRKSKRPSRADQQRLSGKLLGYSAAASAALAASGDTLAAPVGRINQNINVPANQTFDLDLDLDGTPDVRLGLESILSTVPGGFDVSNSVQRSSTPLMSNVGYYRYTRNYQNSTNRLTAYAKKIGLVGQIATSGDLRNLSAGQNVDATLMDAGAELEGKLGEFSRMYFYNQNSSSVRYIKKIFSDTGFGGRGDFVSSFTTNSRFGGYGSGPYSSSNSSGKFLGTRGFLGVEFNDANSDTRYAWIDVEVEFDVSSLTIHGWGYEAQGDSAVVTGDGLTTIADWKNAFDAGDGADVDGDSDTDGNDLLILQRNVSPASAATVSTVPEPSTLAGLAMGVVGVLALRRRRQEQGASES